MRRGRCGSRAGVRPTLGGARRKASGPAARSGPAGRRSSRPRRPESELLGRTARPSSLVYLRDDDDARFPGESGRRGPPGASGAIEAAKARRRHVRRGPWSRPEASARGDRIEPMWSRDCRRPPARPRGAATGGRANSSPSAASIPEVRNSCARLDVLREKPCSQRPRAGCKKRILSVTSAMRRIARPLVAAHRLRAMLAPVRLHVRSASVRMSRARSSSSAAALASPSTPACWPRNEANAIDHPTAMPRDSRRPWRPGPSS